MILLPNGIQPKTTEPLSDVEIQWLAVAEDVLRKLKLTLACPRCLTAGERSGAVIRGNNDPNDPVLMVECNCRRLRFQARQAN